MTRLLFLLLLVVTGLRLAIGNSLPDYMQADVQAAVQYEEDEQEARNAGTQEQSNSKQENDKFDNDDKIHPGILRFPAPIYTMNLLQVSLPPGRVCSGFSWKPFTPPDLFLLHI